MTDMEKVIRGLEEFKADFKPFAGNRFDWQKVDNALELLKTEPPKEQEPSKYEYHIDHTDCIWHGTDDNQCPSTCSQYRDGWNDAMDYIFKGGKGYQPYKRR